MKRFFGFLALLCLFFRVGAQEHIKEMGLKVGERVPDVVLEKVLHNGGRSLRLSDFRGKLLVVDFWATSCGACIEAMPRMDSLVAAFLGKLVVLPVTVEKTDRIVTFQRANRFLKRPAFRTVVEDRVLEDLFPHRLLPHEVWISGDGVVLGFTEAAEVTGERVREVLAGKGLAMGMKEDALAFDRDKPLLIDGNGGADSLYRYRSVMTGRLRGLPSGVSISYDTLRKLTVVRATNVTVRRLYTIVFKGLRLLPDSLVELGLAENPGRNGAVEGPALFCYELDLPGVSPALVRRSMREDLDRFFGLRSEWKEGRFRLLPLTRELTDDEPLTL